MAKHVKYGWSTRREYENATEGAGLSARGSISLGIVFVVLLIAVSIGRPRLQAVELAALTHLIADQPWTYPETFWWSLMGPRFHQGTPIRVEFVVERLMPPARLATEILAALLLPSLLVILHPPRRLPETPGERIRSLRARLLGNTDTALASDDGDGPA
jgi:hypothetical protein